MSIINAHSLLFSIEILVIFEVMALTYASAKLSPNVLIKTKKVVLMVFTRWRSRIPSTPRDVAPKYNNGSWLEQRSTMTVFNQWYTT